MKVTCVEICEAVDEMLCAGCEENCIVSGSQDADSDYHDKLLACLTSARIIRSL